MPDGTGDIKRGRKFDQVIEGARTVFMANGFEGASVDDIAREAGVSKATLYNYFPDKRLLFMEVAKLQCRKIASQAIETMDFTQPVADVLLDGARHMIDFITSDFGQRVFRICVAESERFPNVGREFFECGPAVVREQLKAYFTFAQSRGDLQIEDMDLAADQFHDLCKVDLHMKIIMNLQTSFTDAEKERVIQGAVEMFLARYGT